jgi:hypothetical protein
MLGEQQVDRFLTKRLRRGVSIQRELSDLLPGDGVKIDRKDTLPGSAGWPDSDRLCHRRADRRSDHIFRSFGRIYGE